ncbi:hypothetical protein AB0J84_32030 [Micromonospora arborensis]|uniref:hypothetical protein n=1 Tax=Micromonospora arborensis TaxID=2116518 RepID=UPI0034400D48
MDTGGHNPGCEKARGHQCLCTQCGGSQHGVQGWLSHVGQDRLIRHGRRKRFESKLAWTEHRPQRLEQTRRNQEITTDLARVDIADWLAAPSPPAEPEDGDPYPSPGRRLRQVLLGLQSLVMTIEQVNRFSQAASALFTDQDKRLYVPSGPNQLITLLVIHPIRIPDRPAG